MHFGLSQSSEAPDVPGGDRIVTYIDGRRSILKNMIRAEDFLFLHPIEPLPAFFPYSATPSSGDSSTVMPLSGAVIFHSGTCRPP